MLRTIVAAKRTSLVYSIFKSFPKKITYTKIGLLAYADDVVVLLVENEEDQIKHAVHARY